MRFDIVTLFPELFESFLKTGVTRRAFESQQVQVHLWSLRDFAQGPYRRVDDRPFGGGPGMVMQAEPLYQAVQAIHLDRQSSFRAPVILFSPQGVTINHALVADQAKGDGGILICGRYEGIDQRWIEACVDIEMSLGDFVLSGGEIAAMALLDAVARLQPGVLSDQEGTEQESFHPQVEGMLDYPHYTRPEVWNGPLGPQAVPEVLLSGHHERIAAWRHQAQLKQTRLKRPDLLKKHSKQNDN